MPTTMPASYDRCGWGTDHGCKEEIDTSDVILVINAAEPEDDFDNGHRMYHFRCAPPGIVTMSEARKRKLTGVK